VDNVANALLLCGTSDIAVGRTYNVSQQLSIEDLVAVVAAEIGTKCPTLRVPEAPLRILATIFGRLPGVPLTHRNLDAVTQRACYATDRIVHDLAYNPPMTIEAGLREFVETWKRLR
jgi:nucleoside-diphosphate-sugar epimerase